MKNLLQFKYTQLLRDPNPPLNKMLEMLAIHYALQPVEVLTELVRGLKRLERRALKTPWKDQIRSSY